VLPPPLEMITDPLLPVVTVCPVGPPIVTVGVWPVGVV